MHRLVLGPQRLMVLGEQQGGVPGGHPLKEVTWQHPVAFWVAQQLTQVAGSWPALAATYIPRV
jgi:hypothetical protein